VTTGGKDPETVVRVVAVPQNGKPLQELMEHPVKVTA
jgi:hypothetical protein